MRLYPKFRRKYFMTSHDQDCSLKSWENKINGSIYICNYANTPFKLICHLVILSLETN